MGDHAAAVVAALLFLRAAQEIADSGTFTRFEGLPNVDALLGSREPRNT